MLYSGSITEGSMPWHGDLRAETGDLLTGEQLDRSLLATKDVSRLCVLNAEHSSLCGIITEKRNYLNLCDSVFSL